MLVKGIALAFLSFALFSFSEASVKALGNERLSIFEIGLFSGLFGFAVLLVGGRPAEERWRDMFRVRRPVWISLRAGSYVLASIFAIIAFTSLPFAEAYAVMFLSPVFATILAAIFLGEHIAWRRVLALVLGTAGVLLVVKPGFREMLPGHLAALLCAVCYGVTIFTLRPLSQGERRVSILAITSFSAIAFNIVAVAFTSFQWPSAWEWALLVMAGGFGALGQIALIASSGVTPANRVAAAQYSQLVWAIVLGIAFFAELPDAVALAGLGLVMGSGVLTFLGRERAASA